MNQLKRKIYNKCEEKEYKVATYISSKALVYADMIGEGCFIAPGAVIGPDCRLGICNHLESSVILSHDATLGNFNFLFTNAEFGGNSKVGYKCFFGLHSTVRDGISIASNNLFGSSSNILKSISYIGGVFVGNPARQLVDKKSDNTIIQSFASWHLCLQKMANRELMIILLIIGAGYVVCKSIPNKGVYLGNPVHQLIYTTFPINF